MTASPGKYQEYKWRFPEHGGTPKSSIFMVFHTINHLFWRIPMYGNPQIISKDFKGVNDPMTSFCTFGSTFGWNCWDIRQWSDPSTRVASGCSQHPRYKRDTLVNVGGTKKIHFSPSSYDSAITGWSNLHLRVLYRSWNSSGYNQSLLQTQMLNLHAAQGGSISWNTNCFFSRFPTMEYVNKSLHEPIRVFFMAQLIASSWCWRPLWALHEGW